MTPGARAKRSHLVTGCGSSAHPGQKGCPPSCGAVGAGLVRSCSGSVTLCIGDSLSAPGGDQRRTLRQQRTPPHLKDYVLDSGVTGDG
ncbi:hypothetical protein AAFF_G00024290 [Aldrovandia affinis]|uniref:Uncharacterized protein n=1 Tax=Aldrovandia affinis TaxID=143900 RepID=A0AAD7T7B3_9TELE|nr:hypothetical protein AAFF_G00024290 [Aldrovandia affinis]